MLNCMVRVCLNFLRICQTNCQSYPYHLHKGEWYWAYLICFLKVCISSLLISDLIIESWEFVLYFSPVSGIVRRPLHAAPLLDIYLTNIFTHRMAYLLDNWLLIFIAGRVHKGLKQLPQIRSIILIQAMLSSSLSILVPSGLDSHLRAQIF